MSEPAIITHDLGKEYPRVRALQSLDLTVARNSIFGFLGPNGAGKTTAMKILLGLARPTTGRASVLGMDVVRQSTEIRRRIGYLPQDPRFYEHLSARETVRFRASLYYRGPRAAVENRVQQCLEMAGIADKADRPVRGFSGGERQRLGLAQSIVNDPELLILDEPAANLDPLGRRDVLALLERLRERCTVFYSTHILDDVERVSDTVAILDRGRLVAQGPVAALLAGGAHPVYRAVFRGDVAEARRRLVQRSWVLEAVALEHNGAHALDVTVSDADSAEREMLRVLLEDNGLRVLSFGPLRQDLEQVFLRMVEGGNA